jgi:hypothetical protein
MAAMAGVSTEAGRPAAGPLGAEVLGWLLERLWPQGVHRPTCKRLAVLTAGLLEATTVQRGDLTAAVARLRLSAAKEASVARRLERLLDDPHLDPERIVPLVQAEVLPALLGEVCREHAAAAAGGAAHGRWYPLAVIVDETSVGERVHVLAAGLAYQGIAVPLAVRTWPQNTALAPGDYWRQLHALLTEVQAIVPPALRDHVVLVADRGYGVSRMLDLAQALGWAWVLRLKGDTALRLRDGRAVPTASLAPHPGAVAARHGAVDAGHGAEMDVPDRPVAAFRKAGWRPCRVVAVWAEGAAEPWLLATNLPGDGREFLTYARRWAIERLFRCWKSHGWDLERLQAPSAARIGRLLTGMVLATLWTLAIAIAHTSSLLATAKPTGQRQPLRQLYLPGCAPMPRDPRPAFAKRSLFTWGRQILAATATAHSTPTQCWAFPDWQTPTWQAFCQLHST